MSKSTCHNFGEKINKIDKNPRIKHPFWWADLFLANFSDLYYITQQQYRKCCLFNHFSLVLCFILIPVKTNDWFLYETQHWAEMDYIVKSLILFFIIFFFIILLLLLSRKSLTGTIRIMLHLSLIFKIASCWPQNVNWIHHLNISIR